MTKSQEVSAATPRAFDRLLQKMEMTAEIDSTEESGSSESTVEKIITAGTEAEMWEADELSLIGGRDIVDVEMQVLSYLIRYSKSSVTPGGEEITSLFRARDGRGMYLLVKAVKLETGEEFVFNTSAPAIVSKLVWLYENGALPAACVIRGKDLGAGHTYLSLRPVPKRAVK